MHVPGYTAGRRLGSVHSSMWLGFDDATGQPVTLRLVQGDLDAVRAGLNSAILVMRALQHPHIIAVHDMVETPAGPVLVLGAAEGGSLADILVNRRTLPPGEMVTACAPIAEALAEIHPHGIVHGAITPDDIVFARDGRPMLAGVGLASIGGQVDLRAPTIAPEIVSNAEFAPPADVYSIAAMGVVALTGPVSPDRLFAASAEQLLATGVAPAAQAVITRAIGRNVGRRPPAETLVNALYAIADPEPVELMELESEAPPQPGAPGPVGLPTSGAPPFADPFETTQDPGPAPAFADDPTGDDELDDVTAYMRQVAAPSSGRRARRGGGDDTTSTTAEAVAQAAPDPEAAASPGGRRARTRRSARAEPAAAAAESPPPRRSARAEPAAAAESPPPRRSARAEPAAAAESPPPRRSAHRSASGDTTTPASSRGRRGGRRPSKGDVTKLASVLVVMLLIAGAIVLFTEAFGGDDELPEAGLGNPEASDTGPSDYCGGPRPAPDEEPPEVADWTQEVQRLYTLRARAFEEVNAELLCQVYAPTSQGLVRDVELMQEYADNDVRTQNLSFEVVDAELVEQNGGTVVLEISDRLPPYQLVDGSDEVVEDKPGMDGDTWTAVLVPVADDASGTPTWRFS
ncbi:protein kinase domain-containing protein [Phytoactinopolyspora limicola]|uniref:protein kinase domain-containing protein n=1 Tax=Phytoactinopolyspora limicola TaxID=2715536 RepID=UPI001A9C3CAA|nr:protein kinase [Phytoactinopolyspora limicola]